MLIYLLSSYYLLSLDAAVWQHVQQAHTRSRCHRQAHRLAQPAPLAATVPEMMHLIHVLRAATARWPVHRHVRLAQLGHMRQLQEWEAAPCALQDPQRAVLQDRRHARSVGRRATARAPVVFIAQRAPVARCMGRRMVERLHRTAWLALPD